MCNNFHLQEKFVEEHVAEMQRQAYQQRLVAGLSNKHSVARHMVSRLGRGLVMLGRWLEHVERDERSQRQVGAPATYK